MPQLNRSPSILKNINQYWYVYIDMFLSNLDSLQKARYYATSYEIL